MDEVEVRAMSESRYPNVEVSLEGQDGNVLVIIGRVRKALRRAGANDVEIEKFTAEASSGDYDHALQVVMCWVSAG